MGCLRLIGADDLTKLDLLHVEVLHEPALDDIFLDALVSLSKCSECVVQALNYLSLLRLGVSLQVDKKTFSDLRNRN